MTRNRGEILWIHCYIVNRVGRGLLVDVVYSVRGPWMPNPPHSRELSGSAMLIVPSAMDNKSAADAATSFSILVVYYVTVGTLLRSS